MRGVVGSGLDSVLIKEPSHTTPLAANSDWYDQEITLADAESMLKDNNFVKPSCRCSMRCARRGSGTPA